MTHLLDQYKDYGVLSLAEHWSCPLMWSHYADQHKGVCIEYDFADSGFSSLRPVEYTDERSLKASQLLSISDPMGEHNLVKQKLFYTKAPQWAYEREWRDVRKAHGTVRSFAKVTAVYFGMRCDTAALAALAQLLHAIDSSISLNWVFPEHGRFQLTSKKIKLDELLKTTLESNKEYDFADYMKEFERRNSWMP